MSTQLIIHEGPKYVCINECEKDTAKRKVMVVTEHLQISRPKNVTQMLFLICLSYRS